MSKTRTVHVAQIHKGYGLDLLLAGSEDDLLSQLADYIGEEAYRLDPCEITEEEDESEEDSEENLPSGEVERLLAAGLLQDAVDLYFSLAEEWGEYYEMDSWEVTFPN